MTQKRAVKLFEEAPAIPDLVKDEAIIVPMGEVRYTIDMDDPTVELLATGLCPSEFALRCWEMLSWKREHYRREAREQREESLVKMRSAHHAETL